MSSLPDVRSRYLALALDARKVIDALIIFVEDGAHGADFDSSLQGVIDSFREKDVFSPLRNHLAFSEYYEQVRTVNEALKPDDRGLIVQKLSTVKSNDVDIDRRKQDAYEAIKLLSAIESRALYYYRPQP